MGIVHYYRGHIRVRLLGNTPERFLNICNANQISIRNVEYHNGNYFFEMEPRDYKRLRPVVRKTAMKPVIVDKQGLPFTLFRYRKHQCFVVGIMLSFFIIYLLSLFIWDISFEGNCIYSDEAMMNYLKKIDIEPGMRIAQIDCDRVEKQFRREFQDITWISAEVSGTRLQIYIKENDEDVLSLRDNTPCNLVASKDGVVESIITRCGTPLVKPGDEVHAGDTLVSGVIHTYDDFGTVINTRMDHADADIMIRTIYDYEDKLSKSYQYKIYTGNEKKVKYCDINGKLFYLGFVPGYENYQVISNDRQVKLTKNFFLPIRYGKKEYVEYYIDTNSYTKEEAGKILEDKFCVFLENLTQKGVQILEKNVKIYENTASFSYSGQICVIEAAYIEAEPIETTEGTGQDEYR